MRQWSGVVIGLCAGALGFCLVWSGWHLYIDHKNLHAIIAGIEQAQRQAQAVVVGPEQPKPTQ